MGANLACASEVKVGTTPVKSFKKVLIGTSTYYDVVTPPLPVGKHTLSVVTSSGTATTGAIVRVY